MPIAFTSAITGDGVPALFDLIERVASNSLRRLPAGTVTEIFRKAVERRPISMAGVPLKVISASQVGVRPPAFAIRVNTRGRIHFSYERYLVNSLREAFDYTGTPLRLLFRRAAEGRARRTRTYQGRERGGSAVR
jgi:GTP-binding protein